MKPESKNHFEHVCQVTEEIFSEDQHVDAMLILTRKNEADLIFQVNSFMESEESKDVFAFMVKFLSITLGDVTSCSFVSESWMLKSPDHIETAEESKRFHQEMMDQYGSVSQCPHRQECLVIMFDDGESYVPYIREINETSDSDKKSLSPIDGYEKAVMKSEDALDGGDRFGVLLTKGNRLNLMYEAGVNKMKEEMPMLASGLTLEMFSKSIRHLFQSEAPYSGYIMAENISKSISEGKTNFTNFTLH